MLRLNRLDGLESQNALHLFGCLRFTCPAVAHQCNGHANLRELSPLSLTFFNRNTFNRIDKIFGKTHRSLLLNLIAVAIATTIDICIAVVTIDTSHQLAVSHSNQKFVSSNEIANGIDEISLIYGVLLVELRVQNSSVRLS